MKWSAILPFNFPCWYRRFLTSKYDILSSKKSTRTQNACKGRNNTFHLDHVRKDISETYEEYEIQFKEGTIVVVAMSVTSVRREKSFLIFCSFGRTISPASTSPQLTGKEKDTNTKWDLHEWRVWQKSPWFRVTKGEVMFKETFYHLEHNNQSSCCSLAHFFFLVI